MSAALALAVTNPVQWNWLSESFDVPRLEPEQLTLGLPEPAAFDRNEEGVSLLVTEGGTQLFVAGFGLFVGKKSERVVVRQGKRNIGEVAFLKLQEIIVGSKGVSFSSDLLEEACSRGVRVSFLGSGGRPFALCTSPMLSATCEIRSSQYEAVKSSVGAGLCKWIVAGKLRNQEKLLRYFARNREDSSKEKLEKTANSLRVLRKKALLVEGENCDAVRGSLMGYEGSGARMYWDCFGLILPESAGFQGRMGRGAGDAVNAALNYGYGILTAHVWGAVMNAGLEPFAGFLHVERSGKPSLVLDLMEEFRQPVVDRAVFGGLLKGMTLKMKGDLLDAESKEAIAGRVMVRLHAKEQHRGAEHQVRSIVQMQARTIAGAVRGRRTYRPYSFMW